jgi:predicted RNA-binding protein (virulence factor B family)
MKVYDILSTEVHYKKEDVVTGIVYEILDSFGAFVAVDNKYSALIPNNEIFVPLKVGDNITGRVAQVRDDGKLTISLREKSYIQMDSDAVMIMEQLKAADGFLPYNDKSEPDDIKTKFNLSKNSFKRAIGRLYKAGAITITEDGIRIV